MKQTFSRWALASPGFQLDIRGEPGLGGRLTFGPNKTLGENWEDEATAVNMFPTSLPKSFIAREGEAPAEPLH
ncbi:MAG: hypothetical protein NTY15_21540, partial [Planctomycetota bacterium]|nr:hypothetical protein [Planctomycetota bacterium]